MKVTDVDQEMFDAALNGIEEQGEFAYEYGRCKYRTKGGNKCAFGHILPDELYHEKFDEEGFGSWSVKMIIDSIPEFKHLNVTLAMYLQGCHDSNAIRYSNGLVTLEKAFEDWRDQMKVIAKDFGLKFSS